MMESDRLHLVDRLNGLWPAAADALETWDVLASRPTYLRRSEVTDWTARQRGLNREFLSAADGADGAEGLDDEKKLGFKRLVELLGDPQAAADRRNERFVDAEIVKYKDLFDTIESNPLTREQRLAAVRNDDYNLVIAGAGTGKTSTMIARAAYLIASGEARPEEILLLAYNKKAAQEMTERIKRRVGQPVEARTIHAVGNKIIGESTGKKASISPLALDDDPSARRFLVDAVKACFKSIDGFATNLLHFHVFERKCFRSPHEFDSLSSYIAHLRAGNVVGLDRTKYKSMEEVQIANWLFTRGVRYRYEAKYKYETSDKSHSQYKPDFHITGTDIYIEHFALNKEGEPPAWMATGYKESREEKLELHKKYGTDLIETFSWQRSEGKLFDHLESQLRRRDIRICPLSPKRLEELLKEGPTSYKSPFDAIASLIKRFHTLYKSASFSFENLLRRAKSEAARLRIRLFQKLYEPVRRLIEERNRKEYEIDFSDMINGAREHLETGRFRSGWRHILVDEFQDTSRGTGLLMKALLANRSDARFFAVGDDWQSIYRFAGADISHMTEFDKHFGKGSRTVLSRTFRFGKSLIDLSGKFVQRNPSQLRKQLIGHTSPQREVATFTFCNNPVADGGPDDADAYRVPGLAAVDLEVVNSIVERIASEREEPQSVLVLGRNENDLPSDEQIVRFKAASPLVSVNAMTVHKSKGLEADHVVLLGLTSNPYGFPNRVEEDPIIAAVLPDQEEFPDAEERRLFYVALTRARRSVNAVLDSFSISPFVEELMNDPELSSHVKVEGSFKGAPCPRCDSPMIIKCNSTDGTRFAACSAYPSCNYTGAICPVCYTGIIVQRRGKWICTGCSTPGESCPRCGTGLVVVQPNRKTGVFFRGCSNYKSEGPSKCSWSEDLA
jgi:DNA helicase-4